MSLYKFSELISIFILLVTGPKKVNSYIPVENADIRDLLEQMKTDLTSLKTSADNLKNTPSEIQKLDTKIDQQISKIESKIDELYDSSNHQTCPDGWHKGKHNCYFMPFWKTSWMNAERYCNRFGAHLVSLEISSETSDVTSYLGSLRSDNRYHSTGHVWLGGFDFYKEGTWRWVTGGKIGSSNWHPGRPVTSTNANCMLFLTTSNHQKWYDNRCESDYNFLCEKEFF